MGSIGDVQASNIRTVMQASARPRTAEPTQRTLADQKRTFSINGDQITLTPTMIIGNINFESMGLDTPVTMGKQELLSLRMTVNGQQRTATDITAKEGTRFTLRELISGARDTATTETSLIDRLGRMAKDYAPPSITSWSNRPRG